MDSDSQRAVEPVIANLSVPAGADEDDSDFYSGVAAKRGGSKNMSYAIALVVALVILVIAFLAFRHVRCGGSLWPWKPCREGFAACGGCAAGVGGVAF